MTEFKQIIGRGTRVRDDYGKLFFNILDYTGSATRLFADPDFDGDPALVTEEEIDETGDRPISHGRWPRRQSRTTPAERRPASSSSRRPAERAQVLLRRRPGRDRRAPRLRARPGRQAAPRRALHRLRGREGPHARADRLRSCARAGPTRSSAPRSSQRLDERGIDFDELADAAQQPDADPFDLLCHLAFNAPLRTRRERAQRLRSERKDFFDQLRPRGPADPRRAAREVRRARRRAVRPARRAARCRRSPTTAPSREIIQPVRRRRPAPRSAVTELQNLLYAAVEDPSSATAAAPLTTAQPLGSLHQVRARHHAQGQGAERRPRPPADAHLDHVPEVPRRPRAPARGRRRQLAGKKFRPAIEPPYRWRDWAANPHGITGDELLAFINQDEARAPGRHARARACSPTCAA